MSRLMGYIEEAGIKDLYSNDSFGKKYFERVAKKLGGKLEKYEFNKKREYRIVALTTKKYGPIEITHDWRRDGTETKPVTTIESEELYGKTGDALIELGRFSIWDDEPSDYAEDIVIVLKGKLS